MRVGCGFVRRYSRSSSTGSVVRIRVVSRAVDLCVMLIGGYVIKIGVVRGARRTSRTGGTLWPFKRSEPRRFRSDEAIRYRNIVGSSTISAIRAGCSVCTVSTISAGSTGSAISPRCTIGARIALRPGWTRIASGSSFPLRTLQGKQPFSLCADEPVGDRDLICGSTGRSAPISGVALLTLGTGFSLRPTRATERAHVLHGELGSSTGRTNRPRLSAHAPLALRTRLAAWTGRTGRTIVARQTLRTIVPAWAFRTLRTERTTFALRPHRANRPLGSHRTFGTGRTRLPLWANDGLGMLRPVCLVATDVLLRELLRQNDRVEL